MAGQSIWQAAQRWVLGAPSEAVARRPPRRRRSAEGLAPGDQVAGYQVERLLGRGSVGALYLAHDPQTDAAVALKVLSFEHEFAGADITEVRERFVREAHAARRLRHPDIVAVYDAGEEDGLAWIAMEAAGGSDLSRYTRPARLLPEPVVLRLAARLAEALAYAHQQGVVHRDVKPANVMVDLREHSLKLTDFGVAQLADAARTRSGVIAGSPSYMSPEQLAGGALDGRSDFYSLGVLLFQLLTGRLPYEGDSMGRLLQAIAREVPIDLRAVRPELPAALAGLVAGLLQKAPERRGPTGAVLAEALLALEAGLPASS